MTWSQPLESFHAGSSPLRTAQLKFRILNYLLSFKLPFSSFQQRCPRYFPRVQILDTHVSASGYGPGLSNLAKTPRIGLVFDVTLCSFHTAQRLSRLDPGSLPCFLRCTSSNRNSHSSFVVHRHLYIPVLAFLVQGAFAV